MMNGMKKITVGLICLAAIAVSSCTKVSKDHAINDSWEYVNFKHADGSVETYGPDTTITLDITTSNQISGTGPQEPFEGAAEIWKDGAISIGDLCCANITAGDSAFWPQVRFFNRLTSSSQYEIFSSTLVLRNTSSGEELRFMKQ